MARYFRKVVAGIALSRPLRKAGAVINNKSDVWETQECMDTRDRLLLAFINKSYNIQKNGNVYLNQKVTKF